MKRLANILVGLALGGMMVGLLAVLLPIFIIWAPLYYYNSWREEKKLRKYLFELGDKNFFCYNNRTDAKDFLDKEIIPKLDKEVEFIYLEGRVPKSSYVAENISLALLKMKNYTRYPHLLKIRNGQMIDESINNEFFNTMNQDKPLGNLLADIHRFFDLRVENRT
jgi:hypothetical protein